MFNYDYPPPKQFLEGEKIRGVVVIAYEMRGDYKEVPPEPLWAEILFAYDDKHPTLDEIKEARLHAQAKVNATARNGEVQTLVCGLGLASDNHKLFRMIENDKGEWTDIVGKVYLPMPGRDGSETDS